MEAVGASWLQGAGHHVNGAVVGREYAVGVEDAARDASKRQSDATGVTNNASFYSSHHQATEKTFSFSPSSGSVSSAIDASLTQDAATVAQLVRVSAGSLGPFQRHYTTSPWAPMEVSVDGHVTVVGGSLFLAGEVAGGDVKFGDVTVAVAAGVFAAECAFRAAVRDALVRVGTAAVGLGLLRAMAWFVSRVWIGR